MRTSSLVAALAVAGLASACTGDPSQDAPTTPASETTTPGETVAEGLPFDCEAVSAAQQTLNDAATAELVRLGIDRTAPEAFTVILLASSQRASDYWSSVDDATTASADEDLRADVTLVTDYWAELETPLAAIEIVDSSPAAVQAAADDLAEVSRSRPDEALAPAQQRVQDELAATCGTEPATEPSPTGS